MNNNSVKEVQSKILHIMKYIDKICRANDIEYFIMGGTALGAVRHGGFIPWDDDLDIFMTPNNYTKFKKILIEDKSSEFVLQEWKVVEEYLEYAKVRMNGTTFIEEAFRDRKDIHQGIYVDVMILHKCPENTFVQKAIYYASKYVTAYALTKRNWVPKNVAQRFMIALINMLPNKMLLNYAYILIYKYDDLKYKYKYCYYITKAKFKQGLFDAEFFNNSIDVKFEDAVLLGPNKIYEYLEYRYGNYMKLPSIEEQKEAVHALIYDTNLDYKEYIKENGCGTADINYQS